MMIPVQSVDTLSRLSSLDRLPNLDGMPDAEIDVTKASFLDIFKGMVNNVIETNEQVDRDMIDLMLGNVDDLATVQSNITKAGIAVDLLVTVKNEALSAYNSIINMQI